MPIPDAKIEEVRAAVDIVDIVGDYVQLKRSGSRYKGLCPFHDEKTPSFSVDPDKNLYHCFGCKAGGDAFRFVQDIEGVGFLESVRMLAERYGIALPTTDRDPEAATERESILHALRFAARFFYHQLTQTEGGRPALDYLLERGLQPKTIKRFGLGYAPDAWDRLLNTATQHQVDPETLEKAGLVIPRKDGSGYYDRYRGRVIFPIFSHIGKVLGFAGRILDDARDQPKYINSPETQVYHKSEVLYGLHQAKRSIRQTDEVMLVEGYTDVISLAQAGHPNVVASSGTALTEEQVATLDRYAKRVLLLYDADEAGGQAAIRGMNLVLEQGMGAYAVELPDGEDPDSYVQAEGADAFGEHVADARQDLPSFLYERARRNGALSSPEDRVDVHRQIVSSIARIPDPNLQREYIVRASEVTGVPDANLFRILEEERTRQERQAERRARRERIRQERAATADAESSSGGPPPPEPDDPGAASMEPPPPDDDVPPPGDAPSSDNVLLPEEKILLRVMLDEGLPMVEFVLTHMSLGEFTEGPSRRMVQELLSMYQQRNVQPDRILNGDAGSDLQRLAASVMVDAYELSANWAREADMPVPKLNQRPREAAISAMTLLKVDRVNEAIQEVRQDLYQINHNSDTAAVGHLQQKLTALYNMRTQIKRREFLEWNDAP